MIPQAHDQFLPRQPLVPLLAPAPAPTRADDDRARFELRLGWGAAIGFFGLFLGWAAVARLDAAAHAEGAVTVSGSRQVVQTRDGGTVSALAVREGERVRRGQVLVALAPAELESSERALTAQVIDLQAQAARLEAEQAGAADVAAPAGFAALPPADRALGARSLAGQRAELRARRAAVAAQKAVLARQAGELSMRASGVGTQLAASRVQAQSLDAELSGMRQLLAKGFASTNRVRQLERTQAQLGSDTAGLVANAASARQQAGEARLQSATLDADRLRDLAEQRRQVQANLTDLLPRLGAARAQLDRTRIRATASGQVVGLAVTTIGAVVSPGQTLLEIVPDHARLVVTAKVSPADADDLAVGQRAEVRLTALHDRALPALLGQITRLSADSFEDERSGQRFYTTEVVVPEAALAQVRRIEGPQAIRAGMPVELLVPLRRRTLLQYLLEPFDRALWSSLRER